jgi:hypothetical protein
MVGIEQLFSEQLFVQQSLSKQAIKSEFATSNEFLSVSRLLTYDQSKIE